MKTKETQKNNLTEWKIKKLSSLFSVKRGGSPRPIEHYITDREDGLNWLKIGDISSESKYITSTSSKILKEGLKKTTLVKPGDFILSNSMSFGRPYISKIETCIHDGWLTFQKIDRNQVNQNFLYYLLLHPNTQNIFLSVSAGSGVQNLKKETVESISLLFPPLPEQNRIVSILETWDKAIEKLSKKIEVKKQIKKGLMQDLLTGKKRLEGFNDKWEIKKLGDICNLYQPQTITSEEISDVGKYKVYGANGVIGYYDKYNHEKSEILITCRGATCGTINFSEPKSWVTGNAMVATPKNQLLNKEFLYYILIFSNLNSVITGLAQPQITRKDLSPFKVKIPELEEQSVIAQILTTADKEISNLENKLKILKEQKRYLLNNLITGTIRTPETLSTKLTK